ncbi:DUF1028 domain-containing protein [Halorussus marinus]|uniref:DUF1028 domain-containing protein n=1 Tax=Halorussus marinus TaxID=2505976 RepID=UPI00106E3BC9|nr:DUF1028 domain-containing protein [Halorussus marinus]
MTFSICVGEQRDRGPIFGVGVATDAPAVGALAPHVGRDGVISTQSFVNVRLGRRGVELLGDMPIDHAVEGLLAADDHSQNRQVHGLDARGNAFAFSGDNCDGWFGHRVREDEGITAAGNMLTGPETLDAAISGYEESADDREDVVAGLIDALAAGKAGGGDERGHSSAAVLVTAPRTEAYHDLRVDYHDEPVAELRRVYDAAKAASDGFSEDSKGRIFD